LGFYPLPTSSSSSSFSYHYYYYYYYQDMWSNEGLISDTTYKQNPENLDLLTTTPLYETFLVNLWEKRMVVGGGGGGGSSSGGLKGVVPMRMKTTEALHLLGSSG